MRSGGVLNIFGRLLVLLSLFLLTPIPFSLYFGDGMVDDFLISSLIGAVSGLMLVAVFLPEKELGYRDGFAVVFLSWLGLAMVGALPYYFSGHMPSCIDCLFESMSGFTTTGSTVMITVEVMPKSVLFWRALTHWLGGMGIIVLSLAILPLLGVGGMQLFQAEMPGPTKDRLAPRIQDTARILWRVYFLFTLVEILLLLFGGVGFYDAVCHAFATMATGGFSTHTTSVAWFDSVYIETVIIVSMFLAGTNFTLHHRFFTGGYRVLWRNEEFRLYVAIIAGAMAVVVGMNLVYGVYQSVGETIRTAAFQVVSIITTTGFGTADFDHWPPVCKIVMVILMLVGGCAGSTGGGIKVVRVLLFFKYGRLQLRKLVHPNTVWTIKLGKLKVPEEVMVAILGFLGLYVGFFLMATMIVAAQGVDIVTSATAVIATLNNIGPGLNLVGPTQNFAHLPPVAKLVLTFCMQAGRLELYTVAVLLTPDFWAMARRPRLRFSLPSFSGYWRQGR